ncbi:MAG: hypothetical protein ACPG4K_03530 [Haloferula sp.]
MKFIPESLLGPIRARLKKEHTHDEGFDRRFGIETGGYLPIIDHEDEADRQIRVHDYHGTPIVVLRRLLARVRKIDPTPRTFIDYGAGLGRCLFLALEEGFDRAIGIECCDAFLKRGLKNLEKCNLPADQRQRINLLGTDALDYTPPAGSSVFFLFNPFDQDTLSAVMERIHGVHHDHPAPRYLIYYNPWHRELLDQHAGFELMEEGSFARVWKLKRYYPYAIYRVLP